MRRTRIRMAIPWQAPIGVEGHEQIWNVSREDPLSQPPLGIVLTPELRNDDESRAVTAVRQLDDRAEHITRHSHALFDRFVAAVRHEQRRQGYQPRRRLCRLPDETGREVR